MQLGMKCDYPLCSNIIAAKCNICGWSFCVRHVEWIPPRDIGGLHPVYSSPYYRCSLCSRVNGKPQIASAYIWNDIGNNLCLEHQPIKALKAFEQSIAFYAAFSDAWNGKAKASIQIKQYTEALIFSSHAIKLKRRNAAAWNNHGVSLTALGKLNEALEPYQRAVFLNRRNPIFWNNLANILLKLDRANDSKKAFQNATIAKNGGYPSKSNLIPLRFIWSF